jgi:hypothetical protein
MPYVRTRTTKAGSLSTTLVESYQNKRALLHIPNAETLAAFEENRTGKGRVFDGSTAEAFDTILRE